MGSFRRLGLWTRVLAFLPRSWCLVLRTTSRWFATIRPDRRHTPAWVPDCPLHVVSGGLRNGRRVCVSYAGHWTPVVRYDVDEQRVYVRHTEVADGGHSFDVGR